MDRFIEYRVTIRALHTVLDRMEAWHHGHKAFIKGELPEYTKYRKAKARGDKGGKARRAQLPRPKGVQPHVKKKSKGNNRSQGHERHA